MENTENVGQLGKEIGELSSQLKLLDAQKEQKYQDISKINSELDNLLRQASELKNSKLTVSIQIRRKKEERDKLNTEVSTLAKKMKALPPIRVLVIRKITRQFDRDGESPEHLQAQIDRLSQIVQTEVISEGKERAIMQQIRELKKKLKAKTDETQKLRDYMATRDALRKAKVFADNLHKEVQGAATSNSQMFVKLTDISKKIAELRTKKLLLRNDINGLKIQLSKINQELSTKLSSWSTARSAMTSERRVSGEKIAKEKADAAEEKLKSRKKLTTNDILAMQRSSMNK